MICRILHNEMTQTILPLIISNIATPN